MILLTIGCVLILCAVFLAGFAVENKRVGRLAKILSVSHKLPVPADISGHQIRLGKIPSAAEVRAASDAFRRAGLSMGEADIALVALREAIDAFPDSVAARYYAEAKKAGLDVRLYYHDFAEGPDDEGAA